jgi:hypothetical protein
MYVVDMINYFDGERIDLKILIDLHLWSHPKNEKVDICMYASLAPEWSDKLYLCLIFKSLYIQGACQVNMNIPAPEIGALQVDPKTQS